MKNKHDMYIDYERSYKRRGRRGKNKLGFIILVVLISLGLCLTAYYIIRVQIDLHKNDPSSQSGNERAGKENIPTEIPTITPASVISPTIQPTALPTIQPAGLLTPVPTITAGAGNVVADTRTPVTAKGIYVSAQAAGSDTINQLAEVADSTEINTMVIDIKDDRGEISYHMDSALAEEIGAVTNTIPDMAALVKTLKDKNIYLIARIVAFKDPILAEKKQKLAIKNPDGTIYRDNNGEGWVNPYKKEVWNYLIDLAKHAAAIGFDEVNFDYIRFSTGEGIANADFGDEAKIKSKEDVISEFTKLAYSELKPLGVYVSADVYGTIISSTIDAQLVGQNYVEMAQNLDYICPMIYPSHFGKGNYGIEYPDLEPLKIISKVLKASNEKLSAIPKGQNCAVVRPWLQDFTATWVKPHMEYGGDEVRQEIEGVYSVGYQEWLLWNSVSDYSVDGLLAE